MVVAIGYRHNKQTYKFAPAAGEIILLEYAIGGQSPGIAYIPSFLNVVIGDVPSSPSAVIGEPGSCPPTRRALDSRPTACGNDGEGRDRGKEQIVRHLRVLYVILEICSRGRVVIPECCYRGSR